MRILLENGNSNIWNSEIKVSEIIYSIINDGKVTIDLNSEGPCCEDIGLYRILDHICHKFSFPKSSVTIETANALESHDEYIIVKKTLGHYLGLIKDGLKENINIDKNFSDYTYKSFGIFVRRPSWERIWISSDLWKNYPDKVYGTFHWEIDSEFHLTHTTLTDLLNFSKNLNTVVDACEFLKTTPYEVESFSISSDYRYCDLLKFYKNFFLEIVVETYFSGNTFFPTEKTWRSVATKTPFIIHGPVDFLKNFKKLGFRTFDKWWSEEYDDYGHEERIRKILDLTHEIANYSTNELCNIYKDMSGVLEHNFELFNKITNDDFKKEFG